MKLSKSLLNRRVKLLASQGIEFKTNCNIGVDISTDEIKSI